jgi:hypothetical protein
MIRALRADRRVEREFARPREERRAERLWSLLDGDRWRPRAVAGKCTALAVKGNRHARVDCCGRRRSRPEAGRSLRRRLRPRWVRQSASALIGSEAEAFAAAMGPVSANALIGPRKRGASALGRRPTEAAEHALLRAALALCAGVRASAAFALSTPCAPGPKVGGSRPSRAARRRRDERRAERSRSRSIFVRAAVGRAGADSQALGAARAQAARRASPRPRPAEHPRAEIGRVAIGRAEIGGPAIGRAEIGHAEIGRADVSVASYQLFASRMRLRAAVSRST